MPKLDLDAIPQTNATGYPEDFAGKVEGRRYRRLAPAAGLTEMGASHVVLEPGAWSSQRHWHATEDELLVMISGEAVLVEDEGRTAVRAGNVCAWPKGIENGHHLINESGQPCVFVVISAGKRTTGAYPDIDMLFTAEGYTRRDGTLYPTRRLP